MNKVIEGKTLMRSSGFTLVELLIAMTLFVIVVTISSTIFVNMLKAQRNIISLMAINDNASLSIEQLAREIRTGSSFDASRPTTELKFKNAQGVDVTYRWNSDPQTLALERDSGSGFQPLTSSEVKIKKLNFLLAGATPGPGDGQPTRVTIVLSVGSDKPGIKDVVTNIQTTVSPRNIE